jgi:hypothetical protein
MISQTFFLLGIRRITIVQKFETINHLNIANFSIMIVFYRYNLEKINQFAHIVLAL